MMLFGWGNMRDPRNDTVAEAQDGRIRKGTTPAIRSIATRPHRS